MSPGVSGLFFYLQMKGQMKGQDHTAAVNHFGFGYFYYFTCTYKTG